MIRISRYIGRSVIGAIAMVLLVITGLDCITAIIDELANIQGNYDFLEVLAYVALTIPSRIYEFIPFATLIGCLAGLGMLASNSELVVIRSAGISSWRIVWMVMRPALLIMIFGLLLGEYIAPPAEQIAQSRRALAESGNGGFTSRSGLWKREGNDYMHFNAVQPNGVLYGVTLLNFTDQRRLKSALYARRASYQQGEWLMEGVKETLLSDGKTERLEANTREWQTSLTPQILNLVIMPPENLSVSGLKAYSTYLKVQGLDSREYDLAFWGKVLQPLAITALVLVAISFVFGPLRQVTMGFRIFSGVIIGIIFRTSQDLLGPASLVFGFSPLYAALAPLIICLLIGALMINRRL